MGLLVVVLVSDMAGLEVQSVLELVSACWWVEPGSKGSQGVPELVLAGHWVQSVLVMADIYLECPKCGLSLMVGEPYPRTSGWGAHCVPKLVLAWWSWGWCRPAGWWAESSHRRLWAIVVLVLVSTRRWLMLQPRVSWEWYPRAKIWGLWFQGHRDPRVGVCLMAHRPGSMGSWDGYLHTGGWGWCFPGVFRSYCQCPGG